MTWFLSKGDAVDDFQRKSFNQFTTFYAPASNLAVSIDIWTCDQDDQPESSHAWSMTRLGTVTANFTSADVSTAPARYVRGQKLHNVSYSLEVDLFSDKGDLQFRTVLGGQSRGNATI